MHTSRAKYIAIGAACLAIGVAGSAGADALVTGKDIKDGSIAAKDLSRKARRALKGARGPQGATGAQGPQGPAGQNGAPGGPGTSGSTAPSLMMGSMGAGGGVTLFAPPGGGSQAASEGGTQVPVPPGTALVARDLGARVSVAPGVGQSVTMTLRLNGVDTALGCTISGTATTCAVPTETVLALPAGGLLSIRSRSTGGAAASNASWGFRIVF